jgi:hypothetical protein
MLITVTDVKPYDGTYELSFEQELTAREWGWIKRLSGYLPASIDAAVLGDDPEFACVLAVMAMRRTGKIAAAEVPGVFDRLIDAPYGSTIQVKFDEADANAEDDAGPPALSSNGSETTSGRGSRTSSETSEPNLTGSGIPGSVISQSAPATLVN